MEEAYGGRTGEHAGEIARQYHRSAAVAGAERGVVHCLAAADHAERAAAYEEVAAFVRMALDLLPEGDPRRPRILARLGLALAWGLALEEAVEVVAEAGELIAEAEGSDAAADYLADGANAVWTAEFSSLAWPLAEQGLGHLGARRDLTWARLMVLDIARRDAVDPELPGIPIESPERRELSRVVFANRHRLRGDLSWLRQFILFSSRKEALEYGGEQPEVLGFHVGDYRKALSLYRENAEAAVRSRGYCPTPRHADNSRTTDCGTDCVGNENQRYCRATQGQHAGHRCPPKQSDEEAGRGRRCGTGPFNLYGPTRSLA